MNIYSTEVLKYRYIYISISYVYLSESLLKEVSSFCTEIIYEYFQINSVGNLSITLCKEKSSVDWVGKKLNH